MGRVSADRQNGPSPRELERAVAFLRAELAEGPMPTVRLYRHLSGTGISVRTLERARKTLGCRARKVGRVWHVTMPTEERG